MGHGPKLFCTPFCTAGSCKKNGVSPMARVTFDKKGNLYGTTSGGGFRRRPCGTNGCGVVFQLKPALNGKWKETVLHEFKNRFGNTSDLILDAAGNLYGTTVNTVFELKKANNWTETVLHTFGKGKDGATPSDRLTFD